MSTRDIQAHIEEIYSIGISLELVSAITDAVMDEVTTWQNRPVEATYAVIYFDVLRVKIRDEAAIKLIILAIRNMIEKWQWPLKEWHPAKAKLAIHFGSRFVMSS